MAEVKISVLPVGQGSSNLIEVLEGGIMIYLALIDCGTEHVSRTSTNELIPNLKKSVKTIQDAMTIRGTQTSKTKYLDFFNISHQDKDHWSLLNEVLGSPNGKTEYKDNYKWTKLGSRSQPYTDLENHIPPDSALNNCMEVFEICYSGEQHPVSVNAVYRFSGTVMLEFGAPMKDDVLFDLEWKNCLNEVKIAIKLSYSTFHAVIDFTLEKNFLMNCKWKMNTQTGSESYQFNYDPIQKGYYYVENSAVPVFLPGSSCPWPDRLKKSMNGKPNGDLFASFVEYYSRQLDAVKQEYIVSVLQSMPDSEKYIGEIWIGGQKDLFSRSFDKTAVNLTIFSYNNIKYLADTPNAAMILPVNADIYFEKVFCMEVSHLGLKKNEIVKPPRMGDDIKCNASSSIILLYANDAMFLFTGDATVHTMYKMENTLNLSDYNSCFITAPHHGAGRTSKGKKSRKSKNDWEILYSFLDKLSPLCIIISAGDENSFGHPNLSFIKNSLPHASKIAEHNIYFSPSAEGGGKAKNFVWSAVKTRVYTCIYTVSKKSPMWAYGTCLVEVEEDGDIDTVMELCNTLKRLDPKDEYKNSLTLSLSKNAKEEVQVQQTEASLLMKQAGFLDYKLGGR